MNEATLCGKLVKCLRKELKPAVIFKHADLVTSGVPDISVTYEGTTFWIEVKYANPTVRGKGLQTLMMTRLSASGTAFYVIFQAKPKKLYIVPPALVASGQWKKGFLYESHDPMVVVDYISIF